MEFGYGWIGGRVQGQVTSKRKEMRGKRPKGTSWFVLLDYNSQRSSALYAGHS